MTCFYKVNYLIPKRIEMLMSKYSIDIKPHQ